MRLYIFFNNSITNSALLFNVSSSMFSRTSSPCAKNAGFAPFMPARCIAWKPCLIAIEAALSSHMIDAVSYTHLDVYKRQPFMSTEPSSVTDDLIWVVSIRVCASTMLRSTPTTMLSFTTGSAML